MEEIMDMPPEQARRVKRLMGIDLDYFLAVPTGTNNVEMQAAVAYLRRLAEEDRGDQEYVAVTLRYEDGLVGLEFADGQLNREHGCPVPADVEIVEDVEVTLPLRLAVDAAKWLKKIQAAQQDEEKIWMVMKTRERLSHWLHHYLPEAVQKRFRQRFEIAPGISAERDYGTAAGEFNIEKFAGVTFDEQTRAEVKTATEWLEEFLLNLVSDPGYDFSAAAVRQALIDTAQRMAQEFAGGDQD
jgi:hypothetical protein